MGWYIPLCFQCSISVIYPLHPSPFCNCFNEQEQRLCWSKTCQVSSLWSIIATNSFKLILPPPTLYPLWSLAHSPTHVGMFASWQEDWMTGMRASMLGFSAPVSKKHSMAVWREECLCMVRGGLLRQRFSLSPCTDGSVRIWFKACVRLRACTPTFFNYLSFSSAESCLSCLNLP